MVYGKRLKAAAFALFMSAAMLGPVISVPAATTTQTLQSGWVKEGDMKLSS